MADIVDTIADCLLEDHMALMQENANLRLINETYRHWIREEGNRTDSCTFNVLGEICDGCKCHRQNKAPQA